jgi:hypothetical protein
MGRRFFGVFAPKNFNLTYNQIIFCMDLDTQQWQSTSFTFNKQIRQLSVANDQLVVEAEDACYYTSMITSDPTVEVISCYRLPIK